MAPPTTTTSEIITTNNTNLFNVNMTNVSKLTQTNYLMWSLQVHALFESYELQGCLDGSTPTPPPTVTIDNVTSVNPEFTICKRQDRLIYSALLGAISNNIQPFLSRAKTSFELWHTLSTTYDKPSRSHISQIKTQLKNWTKGNRSITEYMQGLTIRMDQLAILGKPMDHEYQVDQALGGLPE